MIKVIHFPDGMDGGNPYQYLMAKGLRKHGVEVQSIPPAHKQLVLALLRLKPNVIHMHWIDKYLLGSNILTTLFRSILFLLILIFCKAQRINIFWTVHNLRNHESQYVSIEVFFSKIIAKMADVILVHGKSAIARVADTFKVGLYKIKVLPHGNYLGFYRSGTHGNALRNELKSNEKRTTFLYFGHIRKYKGIPELVNAFKRLKDDSRLIIAGEPISEQIKMEILHMCSNSLNIHTFLRFIHDDEVSTFFEMAHVVVLPYRDIFTSGSLLLALSFNKPVIAPRLGLIPDYVDESCAFLYESHDPTGIYNSLSKAIESRYMLEHMSLNACRKKEEYNWDNIGAILADLYNAQ